MQFLNPKTDFAFKKIFGSEHSKEILISFLNALLGLESPYRISEVNILDPYVAPKIKGMKDIYLDVKVKDERGHHYVIEMQVLCVEGIEKRILYNACKTFAGQIQRGEDYQLLTDVIAISITDFIMFHHQPATINKFKLRAEDGEIYSDDLELIFAELPKFDKSETELETVLDRWFYFMKHAKDLRAIPDVLKVEPAICQAFEIANRAGMSADEWEEQERREMFIQDQRGAVQYAVRVATEQALVKGEEIGYLRGLQESEQRIEDARQAERVQIARGLLEFISDNEVLAARTGLTVAQIQALRDEC